MWFCQWCTIVAVRRAATEESSHALGYIEFQMKLIDEQNWFIDGRTHSLREMRGKQLTSSSGNLDAS